MGFCVGWVAGATAQIEVFSPRGKKDATYQLKYIPGFRSTIRPPVEDRQLGEGELQPINEGLDQLVQVLDARADSGAQAAAPPAGEATEKMSLLGGQLLDLVIPKYVKADLRTPGMYLEVGMDDALLQYPWELMHDGEDFLCLKHALGRFVNSTNPAALGERFGGAPKPIDSLSVLVISVPRPVRNPPLAPLPGVEAETEAILQCLSSVPGVKVEVLPGKKATFDAVYQALRKGYQIVHFGGHARFNADQPRSSGLVLHDRDMLTGAIAGFFGAAPPILCFVNACETTRVAQWKGRYDIFDLARAFLDTGTYLVGSRWPVNDKAAAAFGKEFYARLIKDGVALGQAVLDARKACRAAEGSDEFGWASYVTYGDPRICFRPLN